MKPDKANEIIADMSFLESPPDESAGFKDDLGIDSLRMVELIVAIEDAYNIVFDESDLDPERLATVGDLYDLIELYTEEK